MPAWLRLFLCMFFLITSEAFAGDLLTSFDLRNIDGHSYIGPVRDQGDCGSCYSFGALAAAESTYNYAHDLYDEQAVDLSESFVVWSLSPLYDDLYGCDGAGYAFEELTALIEHGVPLERDFPYVTTSPDDSLHWDDDRITFSDWYRIPINDIETTKRILINIGAVDASVYADYHFDIYDDGIFENNNTAIDAIVPYYTPTNHLISLVGWNDAADNNGLGTWILRNSWGEGWANDGYMDIRYTSAAVLLESSYLIAEPWSASNQHLTVLESPAVDTWSSGGALNSHGIDLWGAAASSVDNYANITAEAVSVNDLSTARGIYLWGGSGGRVANTQTIKVLSQSQNNQAISYAICLQGGQVGNSGLLYAESESQADQALAFGIWAANGSNPIHINNSGSIIAHSHGSSMAGAYGIWADSRNFTQVFNSGFIQAQAEDYSIGVLLSGGPSMLHNSGVIESLNDSMNGMSVGVYASDDTTIYNNGTIKGDSYSVRTSSDANTELILSTGSSLVGDVSLSGTQDSLLLIDEGSEDGRFYGVESLKMSGTHWKLGGDSFFNTIEVASGRLELTGNNAGDTTVLVDGVLSGNGSIAGNVINYGRVAAGSSIGEFTVAGDYSQDEKGVLEVEVGAGHSDMLTVTGTAQLAGSLLVLPHGYATSGSYEILDAQNIVGEFASITSSAVLNSSLVENSSSQRVLTVERNSYSDLSNDYNSGISFRLDALRPIVSGDLSSVLDRLDLTMNPQQLNDKLENMTPRISGLATTVSLMQATQRLRYVSRHLNFAKSETVGDENKTATVWCDLIGQKNTLGRDGAYSELHDSTKGLIVGLDFDGQNGVTFGGAVSIAKSEYHLSDSADEGDNENFSGYLYAGWRDVQQNDGLYISALLSSGYTDMQYERAVPFLQRRVKGDHSSKEYSAQLSCGYTVSLGHWTVDPVVRVGGVQLREKRFTEKNGDGVNLVIDGKQSRSVQGQFALRIGRSFKLESVVLQPNLYAEWHHEFDPEAENITAKFAESQPFSFSGRDRAKNNVMLGLELNAMFIDRAAFQVRYECMQHADGRDVGHVLALQASIPF